MAEEGGRDGSDRVHVTEEEEELEMGNTAGDRRSVHISRGLGGLSKSRCQFRAQAGCTNSCLELRTREEGPRDGDAVKRSFGGRSCHSIESHLVIGWPGWRELSPTEVVALEGEAAVLGGLSEVISLVKVEEGVGGSGSGDDSIMEISCAALAVSNVSQLVTFLMTLQTAAMNVSNNGSGFDPKSYMDMPLKKALWETQAAFYALPRFENGIISNSTLNKFMAEYLDAPGSDIISDPPLDYWSEPDAFLMNVQNPEMKQWALKVHSLWVELTRRVADVGLAQQDQSTILPLPSRFVIAGSRFREPYYWDSYWIVRGLIVSRMISTAQTVVENLLSLTKTYGFVPNGARSYYLNRSQPPLLSEMVKLIFMATGDMGLLERALPTLLKEHEFWTSEPHNVRFMTQDGTEYTLIRYHANWNTPRPESYTIDLELGKRVETDKRGQLFLEIASAAESGWDFSSRWMGDHQNLTTLRTTNIVPVDLNAFVFQMEKNIGLFAKYLGEEEIDQEFSGRAINRRMAINSILWDDSAAQWFDYWLPLEPCTNTTQKNGHLHIWRTEELNRVTYASNFIPIWVGLLFHDSEGHMQFKHIVHSLDKSGLLLQGGIATSLNQTGQQWDYPNGWAPLQHMIIEGLATGSSQRGKQIAAKMAENWLRSNYVVFQATGQMHEKYDVSKCGAVGGGGEYIPQTGFGWTNGVALDLLNRFGWPADKNTSCPTDANEYALPAETPED